MTRLAWLCYAFCAIVATAFIVATTGEMPAHVASHFGQHHAANAWMSRDGYLLFMLAFGVGLPAVVVGAIAFLPRLRPDAINIPHRDYWLEPARREETIDALSAHGAWFGCLLTLFFAGIHYVVLDANRASPAQLPVELFVTLMASFAGVLALWIGSLWLRFRRPR
jgi:cation transporter-like permease